MCATQHSPCQQCDSDRGGAPLWLALRWLLVRHRDAGGKGEAVATDPAGGIALTVSLRGAGLHAGDREEREERVRGLGSVFEDAECGRRAALGAPPIAAEAARRACAWIRP